LILSWETIKIEDMENLMRLDKLLSDAGYCSKKRAAEFLKNNMVLINGIRTHEPGTKLNVGKDTIGVNGNALKDLEEKVYYLLNKPKGVVSTVADEHNRPTVVSLIPETKRIFPVGRLDENTSGLIILTNDGIFSNRLTHPSFHTPKTYELTIRGFVPKPALQKLRSGVALKDGKTSPAKAETLKKEKGNTVLEMTIKEGRNRQIRRMCGKLNLELLDLKRVVIGDLRDSNLKAGEFRKLSETEINNLKRID